MNLLLSDIELNLEGKSNEKNKYINLLNKNISNCIGCFGCWTKTPGKCIIRDDATEIYP